MRPREKTHCHKGHPLSGPNMRLTRRGRWLKRICRTCAESSRRTYIIRKVQREAA
jgi:hypothetical protein